MVFDLGNHYTGYFTFGFEEFHSVSDLPIRVKFTLGGIPLGLTLPFDTYKDIISRAWL